MSLFGQTKVKRALPVVMGGVMGLMMMWMLHGALTGDGVLGDGALALFILAHLAVAGVLIGAGVFAARLSPRMRGWQARLHRPSVRHVAVMLGSAVTTAGIVHLTVHGGLV